LNIFSKQNGYPWNNTDEQISVSIKPTTIIINNH
jgi:hypothetical protein